MRVFILSVTTGICAVGWVKWKISMMALAHYIVKNGHKIPDNEEIKESVDFVIRHLLRQDKRG